MGLFVGCSQVASANVRVDLRGHQALVPQQFLHAADVGTSVEQVRGKAVSQGVRASALIQASGA